MSIELEDILLEAGSDLVYKRGQKYYYEGRVGDLKKKELMDTVELVAYVDDTSETYEARVRIKEEKIIVGYECECPAYYQHEGACRHVTALLFKYYCEEVNHFESDHRFALNNEKMSHNALVYYEDKIMREQELEVGEYPTIKVYPKLIEEYHNSFSLGISVGDKRPYVVKDLYDFTNNMIHGNNVSYGKNLEFIHDISLFEEGSRDIIRYIMDKTTEYEEVLRQAGLYRGFNKSERKTIPLSAKALDEFFNLVKWQTIDFSGYNSNQYNKLKCIDADPIFSFNLTKNQDYYEIKTSIEQFKPINCSNNKYLLIEDNLYRLSGAFGEDVFPLLVYMYEGSKLGETKHLLYKETSMKRFMLSSVPKIEKHIPVVMQEELQKQLKVEPAIIKVYVDMDEAGDVVVEVQCHYGNMHFNPYKKLSESEKHFVSGVIRDLSREARFNGILKNYNFKNGNGKLYLEEEEDIYHFLKHGIADMLEVCEVNVTDRIKQIKIVKSPIGSVGLRIENNMLHVALNEVNMPLDEVKEMLGAYRIKSKYYRLRDGSFVDMEEPAIKDMANLVEGLGISDKNLEQGEAILPKYRVLYLDQLLKQSEEIEAERDKYFKQIVRDIKNVEDADYEVPTTIKANLRSYQKRGYRWLKTMATYGFGGILADDMGLGKTLQIITLIASEIEEGKDKKISLVVCPTSLTLNWENEIKRFAPHIKAVVVTGGIEERRELLEKTEGVDVFITSYELLKRDIDFYENIEFRYCIADEAQYIKNANTLNAKALKIIKSEVHFALTGTPIENSLAELWSIFDFMMPGYLFSYTQFKQKYEMPIVNKQDELAVQRLKKMVAPFIIRRLKKEVLKELPDKTETVIYNTMEEVQKNLYLANLQRAKEEMKEEIKERGMGKSHIKVLALLTRLRQLCCHPSLYLEEYDGGSGKLEQCMEIIKESIEAGHRILLFSQFTTMLDIIADTLTAQNINYFMLTGSTKAETRMKLVNEFNESKVPIFLISLKAGGTGLNLTGADVVIHYDPWWNLSSQNQATDRAYRIGQKNNVQVFQLITKDSIEEKIKELQDRKIGLTDSVLQEGETLISKMSEEEIKGLFE